MVDVIYANLVNKVLSEGESRNDRTGVGTISTFGEFIEIPLDKFPLLTTKKMYWKGIVEELLWFISGDTNEKTLSNKGINIWKGNDLKGNGDLGPIYGFQWRHFGSNYVGTTHYDPDCDKEPNKNDVNTGFDQLNYIINELKNNQTSRRIFMSSWNPSQLHEMALPPCHVSCQFYVSNGNGLSCLMTQRSADLGLGLPFNIASYALLTHILAHICDLIPLTLKISIGDCHIYKNHIEPLSDQIERNSYNYPTLKINTDNKNIDGFKFEDFVLENYEYHPSVKMSMAV